MEAILTGVEIVLTIFFIIAIGAFCTWRKWFDENTQKVLSFLVTKVGLPCMVVSNIIEKYTRDDILGSLLVILVPIVTIFVNYWLGQGVARLIRLPKNRRGVFTAMFAFSNTIFIGLPVNVALFGEATVPYTMLYYVSQTFIFWTLGISGIRKDGEPDDKTKIFTWAGMKKLFTMPLIAFFVGMLFVLLEIPMPKFLGDGFGYIGKIVTPLSLLFTGIVLYNMGFKSLCFDWSILVMSVGRFLISPLLVFAMMQLMPISADLMSVTLKTFLVQASMPIMTQTVIFAKSYGADAEYATQGLMFTTILSVVFIPLYAWIGGIV